MLQELNFQTSFNTNKFFVSDDFTFLQDKKYFVWAEGRGKIVIEVRVVLFGIEIKAIYLFSMLVPMLNKNCLS